MAKNTQPIAKRCKALGISPTVMVISRRFFVRERSTKEIKNYK